MPVTHTGGSSYNWTGSTERPAKPAAFSRHLLDRFIETPFARETTLAQFLTHHPTALTTGVLNQLHRRHIVPWAKIRLFATWAAGYGFNRDDWSRTIEVFNYFGEDVAFAARQAKDMQHGPGRAGAWTTVANTMCWKPGNVFVGMGAYNQGTDIDRCDELDDVGRRSLLMGTPWARAETIYGAIVGVTG
ncbi:hypothetical protein [Sagittula sp. S175]|uniref:hypothetical protein n=1 Tax=Sagittula sp. S175 TaxID=3415129 RepID=UPI003C7AD026